MPTVWSKSRSRSRFSCLFTCCEKWSSKGIRGEQKPGVDKSSLPFYYFGNCCTWRFKCCQVIYTLNFNIDDQLLAQVQFLLWASFGARLEDQNRLFIESDKIDHFRKETFPSRNSLAFQFGRKVGQLMFNMFF